jgi:hypothetical protein
MVPGSDGTSVPQEGTLMNISSQKEVYSEYFLDDGNKILIKQNVNSIVKMDYLDQFGDPVYVVEASTELKLVQNHKQENV